MIAQVRADGGEGRSVVYLPGIDGSGDLLLGTADALVSSFRLLRLCYEDAADVDASYASLAAGVAATLRERGATPALLLAESFGGAVALRVALDHPDVARCAVLVNTFPYYSRRLSLAISRLGAAVVPRPLFEVSRQAFGPAILFAGRRERDAIARFRRLRLSGFDRAYRRRLAMIAALDLRPELARLSLPVRIVAGSWDLVVDSVRQARSMERRLQRARLEVVPRGGHLLLPLAQLDWPRRLHEVLAEADRT